MIFFHEKRVFWFMSIETARPRWKSVGIEGRSVSSTDSIQFQKVWNWVPVVQQDAVRMRLPIPWFLRWLSLTRIQVPISCGDGLNIIYNLGNLSSMTADLHEASLSDIISVSLYTHNWQSVISHMLFLASGNWSSPWQLWTHHRSSLIRSEIRLKKLYWTFVERLSVEVFVRVIASDLTDIVWIDGEIKSIIDLTYGMWVIGSYYVPISYVHVCHL